VVSQPANGALSGAAPNLTYTPKPNFAGSDSFTFRVSDGTLSSIATVSIAVSAVNDAPVLVDPGPQQGFVGTPAELTLAATDPENDSVTFGVSGLPPGMVFNPTTRVIRGILMMAGSYTVNVEVSDGVLSWTGSFVWTVGTNGVLVNPGLQIDRERNKVRLEIETTLPRKSRGIRRTFTAVNLPRGLEIDSRDGEISGRIDRGAAGVYATRVSVRVGGETYTVQFLWVVLPAASGDNSGPGKGDDDDRYWRGGR
jgi:hypothetical protein